MKNEQRDEQLSALLDDGLDDAQLQSFMQDLKRDPIADAESTQRYRLIGDVMRDEIDQTSFMDISAAVHRAVEQEPEYSLQPNKDKVEKKSSSFNLSNLLSSWVKPLSGMAVAASVAMVTLVTFNTVQNESADVSSSQLAQVVPTRIEKVNTEISRNVQVASTLDIRKTTPQQQKQLNQYLLQHSGYASQTTMQGMMPYVRAADVKSEEIKVKK